MTARSKSKSMSAATLCRHGFHDWLEDQESPVSASDINRVILERDVMTLMRCRHCGCLRMTQRVE